MKILIPGLCLFTLLHLASGQASVAQSIDTTLFHGLKTRSIGPAGMSGRITSIKVARGDKNIIYAGSASGGLWRSESGGINWRPVFESENTASIGAIELNPTNPDEIWIGTGEGNPRNSQTSGNGVYKSIDGGNSWQHTGLAETRNIHRVLIDPHDPETIYVGAQGSAWGPGEWRGVFKTTDGGKKWEKILYVNENTGIADLVMDPQNPNKLIAAMWEFRRWPWFFKSGGPGSGIFITWDGGEHWKKISDEEGLPPGELGRTGLAIAPSDPSIVYALVESKVNALYKSQNGGLNWTMVSDKNIGNRPFYYAELYVDPSNENRIYNLHSYVTISEDGGKTFNGLMTWSQKPTDIHPDHHAWWIDPDDPGYMINGNDGGLNITRDGGKSWRFVQNLPLAQFYHINYDMDIPYHVYGGMQDNGSWRGPAYVWKNGGIRNSYWEEVNFGDGFDVMPDPENSRYGYAMYQGGHLSRYDVQTGHRKLIMPVHPDGLPLRFNWNAGIAQDPFDPATLYFGSQYLHKSIDRGDSWMIISPDLTTNDKAKQKQAESGGLTIDATNAENYTTILSIGPSPVEKGVIWVGTDDGQLQLTRDGGNQWTNLSRMLQEVPAGSWIAQIHPSAKNAGEAFVVINNYRRDDWKPYVMHTINYGKSWKNIASSSQVQGYALSIVQDPEESSLLFLGTESGLYFSIDYGKNWTPWTNGYPGVSTMDLKIHPREKDLVIGTFGRAAYIIDDIAPITTLARDGIGLLDQPLKVFPPRDAYLAIIKEAEGIRFAGNGDFIGENRSFGASISFYLKTLIKEENKIDTVDITITSENGDIVRNLKSAVRPGFNRTYWDLRCNGIRPASVKKPSKDDIPPSGYPVMPGHYTVKVAYGDHYDSSALLVKTDPRIKSDISALKKQQALWEKAYHQFSLTTELADQLRSAEKTVALISSGVKESGNPDWKIITEQTKVLADSIENMLAFLYQPEHQQGMIHDNRYMTQKAGLITSYLSSLAPSEVPGKDHELILDQYESDLEKIASRYNHLFAETWPSFIRILEEKKFSVIPQFPIIKLND